MDMPSPHGSTPLVVLDTNIVLDLLLFHDAAAVPLRQLLQQGGVRWIATPRMRDELERVLAYPQIAPRLAFYQRAACDVLAQMDALSQQVQAAERCCVICKDADDQCFIDLAVAHKARLLSKDGYVLRLRKRLVQQGVQVAKNWQSLAGG